MWRYEQDTEVSSNGDQFRKKPIYGLYKGAIRVGYIYDAVDATKITEILNRAENEARDRLDPRA